MPIKKTIPAIGEWAVAYNFQTFDILMAHAVGTMVESKINDRGKIFYRVSGSHKYWESIEKISFDQAHTLREKRARLEVMYERGIL